MSTRLWICPLCGASDYESLAVLRRRPEIETDYGIPPERYERHICRCRACRVYFNAPDLLPERFYSGDYNAASYRGRMRQRYEKIRALPPEQSDNKNRAARIDAALRVAGLGPGAAILDVGTGLCVFLAEMKERGYRCSGLDPDPVAVEHARAVAGIDDMFAGTLETYRPARRFDLVTFNKVLEHVKDPVAQLGCAARWLAPGGRIYVEVPDGDGALAHGTWETRGEFCAEHLTIYNRPAFAALAERAGCDLREATALVEPSGKCTLFGFLQPEGVP